MIHWLIGMCYSRCFYVDKNSYQCQRSVMCDSTVWFDQKGLGFYEDCRVYNSKEIIRNNYTQVVEKNLPCSIVIIFIVLQLSNFHLLYQVATALVTNRLPTIHRTCDYRSQWWTGRHNEYVYLLRFDWWIYNSPDFLCRVSPAVTVAYTSNCSSETK